MSGNIMTVRGPLDPSQMGFTLPHEHVLVDFIGADQVSPERYDAEEAFRRILPHLEKARALGCRTFVECTPSYLGKDPVLLKRLSEASGLHMLTNIGYYGAANDKYVPAHAYDESADQLAARWIAEWEHGMEGTGIRPGFIKIGVDPASLSAIDARLVRAAARTHLRTGLVIMSHTGYAVPAREQRTILQEEGVHPSAWIWTHAQNEADNDAHEAAARAGAWVAFDGCREDAIESTLNHLIEMKKRSVLDRVHLSHDAGWFRPGEPNGGAFTPFTLIFETFLERLKSAGFTPEEIHQVTVVNPAMAFTVEVRAA